MCRIHNKLLEVFGCSPQAILNFKTELRFRLKSGLKFVGIVLRLVAAG